MTTDNPNPRRTWHTVPLQHLHLDSVTRHRRRVFTDATLAYYEHTVRGVWADLNIKPVGEADHVHLLLVYPPTPAISVLAQQVKRRTAYTVHCKFTGLSAPARADTDGRRPTSPSPLTVRPCQSSPNASTDKARPLQPPGSLGDTGYGVHRALKSKACAQQSGQQMDAYVRLGRRWQAM